MKIVEEFDLHYMCMSSNIMINALICVVSALDISQDITTMMFHRKCPISPYQTDSFDTQSNVKQCMNCDGQVATQRGPCL